MLKLAEMKGHLLTSSASNCGGGAGDYSFDVESARARTHDDVIHPDTRKIHLPRYQR